MSHLPPRPLASRLRSGLQILGVGLSLVWGVSGAIAQPASELCGQVVKNLKYKHPLVLTQAESAALSQAPNRQRMSNASSRCPPGMYTPDGKLALAMSPPDGTSYTLAERPTFYIYFPFQSVSTLEFQLYAKPSRALLYSAPISLGRQRGILALQLPPGSPALQLDRDYLWSFKWSGEETVSLQGTIRRITPSSQLSNQLRRSSEQAKPMLYAQAGLWQDALTSLIQLCLSQPTNPVARTNLLNLLTQVQLQELANEPIVTLRVQP